MPLFEYGCPACGLRFEALVRGDATPPCPECGATSPTKLLSSFAVNSENTRSQNLSDGRRHAKKTWKEQKVAEAESLRHAHDHHH
jgi:putative FmdB family regulatory protein